MKQKNFPDWEKKYQDEEVESMPWFYSGLDPDLERALDNLNICSGTILDLGTGPGTQAVALAQRGFLVTATDISQTAVNKASHKVKGSGINITFKQDDILMSKLDQQFDFVFDRGCFQIIPSGQRQTYLNVLKGLIKPQGYLFLKCFSHLETLREGPYRFAPEEIEKYFSSEFKIDSIEKTVYQGAMDPLPKALFCILQKV